MSYNKIGYPLLSYFVIKLPLTDATDKRLELARSFAGGVVMNSLTENAPTITIINSLTQDYAVMYILKQQAHLWVSRRGYR